MDHDDVSDLSSELSSVPSMSPPPNFDCYPSPPNSQDPDGYSTPSSRSDLLLPNATNDEPPARKRRKIEPKPRTTQYLDLNRTSTQSQEAPLELLIKTLRKRRKIVVVAGAGISVSAGIPDFRSSEGLFKSLKSEHKLRASGKQLFDASVYKNDDSTSSFHDMVRSLSKLAADAEPTAFHNLLAKLASDGRLMRLYTQNVDGLDTSLGPLATQVPLNVRGPKWPLTIQLHGGLEKMVCQKCNHIADFEPSLFQGPHPPLCSVCTEKDSVRDVAGKRSHGVGKLRPRIVLYNEYNPDEEAIGSVVTNDLRNRPDALIVVGTSLKIPGVRRIVREMCGVVRGRRHGVTIWINKDSTPSGKEFEDCWDLIVTGESDEVARHASLREHDADRIDECTASDVERVKEEQGGVPDVVVMTPKKSKKQQNTERLKPLWFTDDYSVRAGATQAKLYAAAKSKTTKNPASKGRSIANVLGKEKATAGKAKVTKKAPSKVGKANRGPSLGFAVKKALKLETPKTKDVSSVEHPYAMAPISPQAARNNGPLTCFPNLPLRQGSNSPPWKDKTTVSPTGRVPDDIARILN